MKTQEIILMGHGGGGLLTRQLIRDLMVRELGNPALNTLDDGACVTVPEQYLVLTTDSYVVQPIFFPGGDIGKLSVCGTVNDLAMQGAAPRYLTLGLILEEGLPVADLGRVIRSVGAAAREAGVLVAAGDTKVVERGHPGRAGRPGLFINTAGLGARKPGVDVSVSNARPGDAVIVSGTIGDHGMAIMNARENLGLESALESDVAALWSLIGPLLDVVPGVRCLRDPTRGGVAAALVDIAESSSCGIRIREEALPARREVRGACQLLGLDPLNVANEGKAVIVCRAEDEAAVLRELQRTALGRAAAVIGRATDRHAGAVVMETRAGGERMVALPTGEDLPRIC
ncbi:MAG: hydrogenase expression/formation protein HypE [Verrucomicrobiota bacterium]|nr:hydrogenase expression/formation protein HypE [Verrucomicrobiota bacterium]